ncbi:stalk domain-containing protein [Paenibacillus montanisoli]|uniref:Endonuclease n=1 Tax=Paenibacillus montanisoli TaxID=2081970 RepID=A0A328U8W3_9BACL|nr:stalk domain-containing protein [Paenibacillus montanisoli]RAP76604.1 hypothetical protein DL346_14670 [Paenibacillus montanisoli]
MKRISVFLVLVFMLSFFLSFSASAAIQSEISVFIDGNKIAFEAPPTMENGTTLVPMRKIFEEQGATMKYEATTKTVTAVKDTITIKYQIGAKTATKNGKSISLAVPGMIIKSSTFVPLRFVSEALGSSVGWEGSSKTITISSANKISAEVFEVIDGDTVKLKYKGLNGDETTESFRLIGVDTPETDQTIGEEPYGTEATNFTKAKLQVGTKVLVEFDVDERDQYGRVLGYVYLMDGTFFNARLVSEGYAKFVTFPPNVRWVELFKHLQTIARNDERGLWSLTGDTGGDSVPGSTPPNSEGNVIISDVNAVNETITVKNNGTSDINLKGWKVVSVTGNQTYVFSDYTLKAGLTVTLVSGADAKSETGKIVWTTKNIWNNREADPAQLFDATGALVSEVK